jgi:hypothetical protein
MALYITCKDNREVQWHVGSTTLRSAHEWPSPVTDVQADGDELDYIINNFPNLPYPKHKRVVRWDGDLAKLIAYNL